MFSIPDNYAWRGPFGKWLTSGLFYETSDNPQTVLYSLKDKDHEGYPSLYRLYLEEEDMTEFMFATKYFENFPMWENLCATKWFQTYILRWRKELELKIRARALKEVQKVASSKDHKAAYEANKFLLNSAWKNTSESKRGRPTKEDIRQEAERLAQDQHRLEQDAQLIGTLN